jgi:hypothetical protein
MASRGEFNCMPKARVLVPWAYPPPIGGSCSAGFVEREGLSPMAGPNPEVNRESQERGKNCRRIQSDKETTLSRQESDRWWLQPAALSLTEA